jgi:hypothetical protein
VSAKDSPQDKKKYWENKAKKGKKNTVKARHSSKNR